jgi:hypothetical protein
MFKIRPEHMRALAGQQTAGFAARMALHLRDVFPEEVQELDDAKLRLFVDKIRARAEEWGIADEAHVERLIELFACFGQLRSTPLPDWVTEIVEYPGRHGEQILNMLEDHLLFGEAG